MTWALRPHGVRTRGKKTCAPNSLQPGARTLRSAWQRLKTRACRLRTVWSRCTIWRCWQWCHAHSPMVPKPASTCTCRTLARCENACGWILSLARKGTRRALVSPCICPLCSAFSAQGLTTAKQLQVPQGLPDGIDQLLLRITADKVQLAAKSAACTKFRNLFQHCIFQIHEDYHILAGQL